MKRRFSGAADAKEKSARIKDFLSWGIPKDEGINMSTSVAVAKESSEKADTSAETSPRLTSGQ